MLSRRAQRKKMGPKEELSAAKLTDDLVVDILSRLPLKSFCRFKCVCKAWFAFSFDPHYCQKLPKPPPTGFFYQDHNSTSIQLVSLSKNDEEIDGTLCFLPDSEQLQFVDCCNGLVLCKYRSNHTSPDIFRFIVCNPATQEWRTLPDTKLDPENSAYHSTKLGFDPSRSPHFYVFNFQHPRGPGHLVFGINQVAMFSSCNSTWLVYNDLWDPENYVISVSNRPHVFLDGSLHVHSDHDVLVLDTYETVSTDIRPSCWTVKLPLHEVDCVVDRCFRGCLGQSSGTLHYAAAGEDGRTIIVWLHDEFNPNRWIVKYRLNMRDALGRDDFVHYEDTWFWNCNYEIIALDLEREVIFLRDDKAKKLLSYSISSGKLNEITDDSHWYVYYAPSYLKLPELEH